MKTFEELMEKVDTLFDAIKHGDLNHQIWLKEAIEAHFDGRPVPTEDELFRGDT